MDPVTAVSNAINAVFTFLNSPVGQQIVADARTANQALVGDIAGLISHLRGQAQKQTN